MADGSSALGDSVAALGKFLVGERTLRETLTSIAELASEAVEGADFAGVSLESAGKLMTSVYTDRTAPVVDEAQYLAGRGPCLDAYRFNQVTAMSTATDEDRWPEFAAAARAHGIRSTLSVPLVADRVLGALNLYSATADAFSPETVETIVVFAEFAGVAAANALAYWESVRLAEQLQTALDSRVVIEQAKGVLIGTIHCTPDEAFAILRQRSQRDNRKLRDIAAEVVGADRPGGLPGPG